MKKNIMCLLLIFLGVAASIVGFIGFLQRNDSLLPIAFLLFISTAIVYGMSLFDKKKNAETNKKKK